MDQAKSVSKVNQTKLALFWMHFANEPFVALFTLIGFILKKELNASMFALSFFATLSPVISFFSFFWGSYVTKNERSLLPNLIGAWVLGRVAFLFLPFTSSVWYLIFAAASYQLFYRASTPAFIQILKQNVQKKERSSFFSSIYILSFIESIFLGLFIGKLLDQSHISWKNMFALAAFISMTSIFFQRKIPISPNENKNISSTVGIKEAIFEPIIESLNLIKKTKEFFHFQMGFMIGGFGLMIINPALIIYYSDTLCLTHENLTYGRYIFMGCGVLLSTYFWQKNLKQTSILPMTFFIIFGFSLFPIFIVLAKHSFFFLYLAFFIYGIFQAGSHLIWHLSGTFFAKEEESSSKYTAANVLMVGIRGLIGPFLGGALTYTVGSLPTLMFGSLVCFSGAIYMALKAKMLIYPKTPQIQ
jgi:predicted MFS family arabinose efflux permease